MRTFIIIVVALFGMVAFQANDIQARSHYAHPTWEGIQQYNHGYAFPTREGLETYRYRPATPTREGYETYQYRPATPTQEGLDAYKYTPAYPECSKRRALGLDVRPGVNCR